MEPAVFEQRDLKRRVIALEQQRARDIAKLDRFANQVRDLETRLTLLVRINS